MSLRISPSIGVARLGNSTTEFMLSPDTIGGLPFDFDPATGTKEGTVNNFKDSLGRVKRQGQVFKVFNGNEELLPGKNGVASIDWTVHLANKKAAWYQYTELRGNLLYPDNNYTGSTQFEDVTVRNPTVEGDDRRELIVDAGPRTIQGLSTSVPIELADNEDGLPTGYPTSFPLPDVTDGLPITSLGTIRTDSEGRLVVFGAYGAAGGNAPLTSYGGSDTWHDDIADGSISCTITFEDARASITLNNAWLIVGSPDFAPEIVNISTLSDTMFDVGIRTKNLDTSMCEDGVFNDDYEANYTRDILPILERFRAYQWVANVQSMTAFAYPTEDLSDPLTNQAKRAEFFTYFRKPNDKSQDQVGQQQGQLFKDNTAADIPMMPINSGSNSVSNDTVVKFLALNETQYFLMEQWSKNKFNNDDLSSETPLVEERDQVSVGNCVGLPMSPGIEVTWSMQNPAIYSAAYRIKRATIDLGTGLNPMENECLGNGCEPGDLTKRMACPWQADFFQCTIQYINFSNPAINKDSRTVKTTTTVEESWAESGETYERENTTIETSTQPLPPSYYSYWWPPQSPWDVLTGETTLSGQEDAHLSAGQQVNYARGINSFVQMVENWYALAFIRNSNNAEYPYFTEVERNNLLFAYQEIGVGQITGNSDDNDTTIPVFYIEKDREKIGGKSLKAKQFVDYLEERAFKSISVAEKGLGMPRSGTRSRR